MEMDFALFFLSKALRLFHTRDQWMIVNLKKDEQKNAESKSEQIMAWEEEGIKINVDNLTF